MAITTDEKKIGPQTNLLISQNRDRDWKRIKEIQNKSEEQLGQEALDRSINQLPPKTAGDELYEKGGYLTDPETETDIELEQRNLITKESMQKVMEILNTGVTTYKTLQQIPIQVIKGLLLRSLVPEAMAGEQPQNSLKINSADIPLGDGMINQSMNSAQRNLKEKYDMMLRNGFIDEVEYQKQMRRLFGTRKNKK